MTGRPTIRPEAIRRLEIACEFGDDDLVAAELDRLSQDERDHFWVSSPVWGRLRMAQGFPTSEWPGPFSCAHTPYQGWCPLCLRAYRLAVGEGMPGHLCQHGERERMDTEGWPTTEYEPDPEVAAMLEANRHIDQLGEQLGGDVTADKAVTYAWQAFEGQMRERMSNELRRRVEEFSI